MSMFMAGIGARTAIQNIPVAAEATRKTGGWDSFLNGAATIGSNYLRGVAAGLMSYRPDNPYSSLGASIAATTKGLQQKLDIPLVEQQAALETQIGEQKAASARQMKREDMLSMNATLEDLYRSQADRASILPDIGGISAGISRVSPPPSEEAPFGFTLKSLDFGAGMGTAAQRTMGLVK